MLSRWSSFCTFVGTFFVITLLVFFFVPQSRSLPVDIIVHSNYPTKEADAIVLLMGDAVDRAPHAADLYKRGYGDKIVFVETEQTDLIELGLRPAEGQMVYDYLTKHLNVPRDAIVFNKSTLASSTHEEILEVHKVLRKLKAHRVTLATSWYHSSRAKWTFEKYNKRKLIVDCVPSPTPSVWYRKENDFMMVFNEYLKWFYYAFRYGIIPKGIS